MGFSMLMPPYVIERNRDRCIDCRVCERQCSMEAHYYEEEEGRVHSREENCINCHRCVAYCPTRALTIKENPLEFRKNANWDANTIRQIQKQAETGGMLLSGMGNPSPLPVYWDNILLNASQVTNPSIDPLREPMEVKTYLGRKPERLEFDKEGNLITEIPPQLELSLPLMIAAMSFGSVSLNTCTSIAMAADEMRICYNTGEGGLHESLYHLGHRTIVQVASGRFGVHQKYLKAGAGIEIKIGQGAKPGIGGHLPGEKVGEEVACTRMIPEGSDALSPAPHHDIYSIEDLRQLIYALKESTQYTRPVSVKIAAVHNAAAIASGMARAGADIITLDGFRGGTGAAPTRTRDNVGIPIEFALASVDERLKAEGIRNQVSVVASGSIRNSSDIVKAIALGADAVYIGTAALVALGCHLCRKCYTGKCNWGIATQDPWLTKRLNPEKGARRLVNMIQGWKHEIKEMMGGMGINAIESLKGNREMLRGVGLSSRELEVLGIKQAGE